MAVESFCTLLDDRNVLLCGNHLVVGVVDKLAIEVEICSRLYTNLNVWSSFPLASQSHSPPPQRQKKPH